MKCVSNKKVYPSWGTAEDALLEMHMQFEYKRGDGPIGVYQCDACGYYHLTSKGSMNERLAQLLSSGKINRQHQANQWLDKIRRKNS